MKYLIVGLGNPGDEYQGTRHNIGYRVLDALAKASNTVFEDRRYGYVAHTSVKNCQLTLLKPTTFMNLSGNAVRYWLNKENIAGENLLVVVDDLSLPVGTLRLKGKGSAGGHNGLRHIEQVLCSQNYARLRVGIGNDFPRGCQVDYVLGNFDADDNAAIEGELPRAIEMIKSFCLSGLDFTMNRFNNGKPAREHKPAPAGAVAPQPLSGADAATSPAIPAAAADGMEAPDAVRRAE